MRKLTDKLKYALRDGHAVLYAKPKNGTQYVAFATCHTQTLDVIKQDVIHSAADAGLIVPLPTHDNLQPGTVYS